MKYIFVSGAPGSKWSSVVKNIYFSPDIDRSDYTEARTYYKNNELMHLGAYWDPGMEFGKFFDRIQEYSKEYCEKEFDRAFSVDAQGVRIIKSHVLANNIDFLRQTWPDCPVVLVHRGNDSCLGWWVRSGQFDITYPDYREYYQNLPEITKLIDQQNYAILGAINRYDSIINSPETNLQLCQLLKIQKPEPKYQQCYKSSDIDVKVIHSP